MERQTVYVFSTAYFPFVGGAEIAIQEVSKRLKDRFNFIIVTARMRRGLPKREVRPEGTIIRVGLGTRADKWFLPLSVFWNLEFGIWNFRRSKNRLLWGMDLSQGSIAAALVKFFFPRVPFVCTLQYGYGDERIQTGRGGMIRRGLSFILSRADHVTAISSYLLGVSEQYGYRGAKTLVPNGVDSARFRRPRGLSPAGVNIVVTTSRLVPKNGIDILIRAIAEVKKTVPDVRCHIIGDGPELNKLKILSEKLKVAECVKFFGSIPYEEIPRYLWQASVFARPSRSEGMGNSFVEALAAGLPIIGTPVGGITDIIEDRKTGFFSKSEDSIDLAEKILTVLQDLRVKNRIRKAGRALVEARFGWDAISTEYENVFSSLLGACSETPVRSEIDPVSGEPRSDDEGVYGNIRRGGATQAEPKQGDCSRIRGFRTCSGVRPLSILIVTPMMSPRLGGPAIYASALSEEFARRGNRVSIISFDSYLRFPSGIRHVLYFFSLARHAFQTDILFSLDSTSVGVPALLVSIIFRIPLVVRVEGDFLWERYVERTHRDITLHGFYWSLPSLSLWERIIFLASRAVVRRARARVCSSEWRKTIVARATEIPPENIAIIRNVWRTSRKAGSYARRKKRVILWAGRILYLKNLRRLVRAFAAVRKNGWELCLIGDGPDQQEIKKYVKERDIPSVRFVSALSREGLLDEMASASFFILPSFSDVGPNVIVEALGAGTPCIMTKESGYAELLGESVLLIDPFDERDIQEKIQMYMDDDVLRADHARLGQRIVSSRGWREAADEWISLFERVEGST